jgi:hypothetical protein
MVSPSLNGSASQKNQQSMATKVWFITGAVRRSDRRAAPDLEKSQIQFCDFSTSSQIGTGGRFAEAVPAPQLRGKCGTVCGSLTRDHERSRLNTPSLDMASRVKIMSNERS